MPDRHRVLLVDDEPDVLFTLSKVLEIEGFDVTAVSGAAEAMSLIDRHSFDAVVSDMRLSEGDDGLAVCRHARQRDSEAVTIVLTAYASLESAVEALREHVSNYLAKPTDIRELKLAITSAIERRELRAALRQAEDDIGAKAEAMHRQAELLELAREAILVRDIETSAVTYWNRGAEAIYGWSSDEAVGQVTHTLLGTQFPTSLEDVNTALVEQGFWEGELQHMTRDGQRVVVDSRQSVQRDTHGRAAAILEVNRDVTDRKAAEEARLRLVEERISRATAEAGHEQLLQLLGQMPAAICVLRGPDHVFEYSNPAHVGMIAGRDVIGQRVVDAFPELEGSERIEILDHVYQTGEAVAKTELPARIDPNGDGRVEDGYINVTYQPLRNTMGQVEGVVAHAVDVTAQVRARQRLEVLAALGRALAGPLDYDHVLDRLARSVVPDFADWCVVDVVDSLNLNQRAAVAHVDPTKEPLAREVQCRHEPISSAGNRLRTVLESGQSWFVPELTPSVNEAGAPDEDYMQKVRQLDPRSMICIPLLTNDQPIGVMSFLISESARRFTVDDVSLAEEVGRRTAAAIESAQLYRQTVEEVGERRNAEERLRFLAEAGELLQSSLDYQQTLDSLARSAVPRLADWCAVHIVDGDQVVCPALAHVDPEKVRLAREFEQRWPPDMNDATGMPNVLRTGRPELYPVLTNEMLEAGARDAQHLAVIKRLGPWSSGLVVPLTARGRTLGTLTLITSESGRRFEQRDLDFAMEVAGRAAVAVDNAWLLRNARDARLEAERLQVLAQKIAGSLEVPEVLDEIASTAAELLRAPVAGVFLLDGSGTFFDLAAGRGLELAQAIRLPRGESLAGRLIKTGRWQVIDDVRSAAVTALPKLVSGEAIGSLVVAPIISGTTPLGAVEVYSAVTGMFTERDAELLSALAAAAATTLEKAQ
ncbi:MAG: GAF domain-containing protein, partial [Chloroflexi bacterium]|nr:GAF domain-containing protein [Chloroflexota bacterium]